MRKAALVMMVVLVAACGNGGEPSVTPAPQDGPATSLPTSSSTTDTAPDDDDRRVDIIVTGGEPVGGLRTESVDVGERVVLRITSDTSDEVYVHGYDLAVRVVPGEPAVLAFDADKPGVWEVELHDAGNLLLELRVG